MLLWNKQGLSDTSHSSLINEGISPILKMRHRIWSWNKLNYGQINNIKTPAYLRKFGFTRHSEFNVAVLWDGRLAAEHLQSGASFANTD